MIVAKPHIQLPVPLATVSINKLTVFVPVQGNVNDGLGLLVRLSVALIPRSVAVVISGAIRGVVGATHVQSNPPSIITHKSVAIIFALAPDQRQYLLVHPPKGTDGLRIWLSHHVSKLS